MDLKERLSQVINNFQTNFDTMETEQDVKEQIEQLQSKLDVLLEENRRENRDEAIRINKGSTMSEVIQNLEVDRSNWGCARTGFIYNQSKLIILQKILLKYIVSLTFWTSLIHSGISKKIFRGTQSR